MGKHYFLKDVGCLDDVCQREIESLTMYYSRFNKNFTNINQYIIEGEIIRAFIWVMRP